MALIDNKRMILFSSVYIIIMWYNLIDKLKRKLENKLFKIFSIVLETLLTRMYSKHKQKNNRINHDAFTSHLTDGSASDTLHTIQWNYNYFH